MAYTIYFTIFNRQIQLIYALLVIPNLFLHRIIGAYVELDDIKPDSPNLKDIRTCSHDILTKHRFNKLAISDKGVDCKCKPNERGWFVRAGPIERARTNWKKTFQRGISHSKRWEKQANGGKYSPISLRFDKTALNSFFDNNRGPKGRQSPRLSGKRRSKGRPHQGLAHACRRQALLALHTPAKDWIPLLDRAEETNYKPAKGRKLVTVEMPNLEIAVYQLVKEIQHERRYTDQDAFDKAKADLGEYYYKNDDGAELARIRKTYTYWKPHALLTGMTEETGEPKKKGNWAPTLCRLIEILSWKRKPWHLHSEKWVPKNEAHQDHSGAKDSTEDGPYDDQTLVFPHPEKRGM